MNPHAPDAPLAVHIGVFECDNHAVRIPQTHPRGQRMVTPIQVCDNNDRDMLGAEDSLAHLPARKGPK